MKCVRVSTIKNTADSEDFVHVCFPRRETTSRLDTDSMVMA